MLQQVPAATSLIGNGKRRCANRAQTTGKNRLEIRDEHATKTNAAMLVTNLDHVARIVNARLSKLVAGSASASR